MIFYFGKHYQSASVGDRMVAVHCESCGCHYFYKMVRIGSGSGSAPYGFGRRGAARSAAEHSQRDLGERLSCEAELVPCPHCHWINEELVLGYRQSRYRGLEGFARWSGFFGILISLIAAWCLANGPAVDRAAYPKVLLYGPAFSIAFALGLQVLQAWLRSRIRPNEDYPARPTLPIGCPPAWLRNPATGMIEVVETKPDPDPRVSRWFDFQIGRHQFPPLCCECLLPAAPESTLRIPFGPAVEIAIPSCPVCVRRRVRRKWRIGLPSAVIFLAVGTGVMAAILPVDILFWFFFVALAFVAAGVGSFAANQIEMPYETGSGDSPRGVLQLCFRNPKFAGQISTRDDEPPQRLDLIAESASAI